MKKLQEWLDNNKIEHIVIDKEVVEIVDFGKAYYDKLSKMKSIFRQDKDGEIVFNGSEHPDVLIKEGINYSIFKFGDNFYYTDLRKDFKMNILKYVGKTTCIKDDEVCNLGVHTAYELLNGSFLPKAWVEKAKFKGHKGIGICDQNTMAGCYALQKVCESSGLKYVFGYSLTFEYETSKVGAKVYVQTQQGLRNLLRIQKAIMVDSDTHTIEFSELLARGNGNVIVLDKWSGAWIKDNVGAIECLNRAFDKVFFQVDLSEYKANRIDELVLDSIKIYFQYIYLQNIHPEHRVDPILLTDAYYLDKDDAKNKIILNKIASGAAHNQSDEQYFKDVDEHYALFAEMFESLNPDEIFEECRLNALSVLNNASARFEDKRNFMPKYTLNEDELKEFGTARNMFNVLLERGMKKLVPKDLEPKYRKQLEYEKYIIESTNNVDYLLVQYDTCSWARSQGILVGCGRGSAAGSLILYLLGITLIDPLKYDLIFERFLLPERGGLYPADVTVFAKDVEANEYVEVTLDNGKEIKIFKDAELLVKRNEETIKIYADELQEDDDIQFDNRDELFTINEI